MLTNTARRDAAHESDAPAAHKTARLRSPKWLGALALIAITIVLRIAGTLWGVSPNIITSDGNGYMAWARNITLEQTFDFAGDIQALYPPDPVPEYPKSPVNGATINQYPPGLGLIELPAFVVAHGLAKGLGLDSSGVHGVYDRVVVTWLVLFSLAGYLAFWRCTELLGASPKVSTWVTLATYFASNLAHYVTKEPFMVHATGFSLAAMGSALFLSSNFSKSWRGPGLAGLAVGLLLITRNSNVALLPWFAALAVYQRLPVKALVRTGVAALLPVAAQVILFYMMNGELGFNGYGGQSFTAGAEGLRNVLFSTWRGLFVFHPIFLFMLLFNVWGLRRDAAARSLFAGSLVCFLGAWVINGTWWCWWFGASFGNRAFIEFLVPLALAWCAGWAHGSFRRLAGRGFPAVVLVCLALNAVLWSGFLLKKYSHEDPLSFSDTYLWWKRM